MTVEPALQYASASLFKGPDSTQNFEAFKPRFGLPLQFAQQFCIPQVSIRLLQRCSLTKRIKQLLVAEQTFMTQHGHTIKIAKEDLWLGGGAKKSRKELDIWLRESKWESASLSKPVVEAEEREYGHEVLVFLECSPFSCGVPSEASGS
uniref:Transposase n=1 Tax=Steinernema glaseri TaxID=37863 RepID=A0A1I8AVV4_9BILA